MPESAPPEDPRIARVIVEVEPAHLGRLFDYRIPVDVEPPIGVGSRVLVPFAGRRVKGLVVEVGTTTDVPPNRLRAIARPMGPHAWVEALDVEVLTWAAHRYAAPVGHVLRHALPARTAKEEVRAVERGYMPRLASVPEGNTDPARAEATPIDLTAWSGYAAASDVADSAAGRAGPGAWYWRPRPGMDRGAAALAMAAAALEAGRGVLVICASPVSAVADAIAGIDTDVVDVRGKVSPALTYRAWLRARSGQARVVIGELGVCFWPVENLGLVLVLGEATPSLKARRSPYHHAREVALERGRRTGAATVLEGLVPSANAWALLRDRRLTPLVSDRESERAAAPHVQVDDGRAGRRTRIGDMAWRAIRSAVDRGGYAVLLASRKGEGTALACTSCSRRQACPTCDASLHRGDDRRCHCGACGWASVRNPVCQSCGGDRLVPLAAGAGQYGSELARGLPGVTVAVLEGFDQPIPPAPAVLVMTRGSVFMEPPGDVQSVVMLDLDSQFLRPTLSAGEDSLRLAMTCASWMAGSKSEAGAVVVQTRESEHPVVRALVGWDPGSFWNQETKVRAPLRLPPSATVMQVDVAAADASEVNTEVRARVPAGDEVLGPLPIGGRASLLIKCDDRVLTTGALWQLRGEWSKRGVDARVDVDPVDVA